MVRDGKDTVGFPEYPISRVLSDCSAATIYLGRALPRASSDLPGTQARRATSSSPIWSFSGWGLPSRRRHRLRWCALTAPFHPCRGLSPEAVCFLWHFPWDRSRWALPSTLPCGARTFLRPLARPAAACGTPENQPSACYALRLYVAGTRGFKQGVRIALPRRALRWPAHRPARSACGARGEWCGRAPRSGASSPGRGATGGGAPSPCTGR